MVCIRLRRCYIKPIGNPRAVHITRGWSLNRGNNLSQAERAAIRILDETAKSSVQPRPRCLEDIHEAWTDRPCMADDIAVRSPALTGLIQGERQNISWDRDGRTVVVESEIPRHYMLLVGDCIIQAASAFIVRNLVRGPH